MISLLFIQGCLIIDSKTSKLTELIERTFNREGSLYLASNEKNAFIFTSEQPKRYKLCSCQKMVDGLHYL